MSQEFSAAGTFVEEIRQPGPIRVVDEHNEWYLCDSSEERLSQAIDEGGVILVNGFLVKMKGKMTGLALETHTMRTGLFGRKRIQYITSGIFYSPTDHTVRQAIRDAFDQGKTRICIPEATEWVQMRAMRDPDGTLLEKAIQAARDLPEHNEKIPSFDARVSYRDSQEERIGFSGEYDDYSPYRDEEDDWYY